MKMEMIKGAEAWKVIPNHPNYWISTWGRIKNIRYHRMLSERPATNGYLQVGLSNNGRTIDKCVHQLMAITFLGKKPNGFEIDHIDQNKENNTLENLRYLPLQLNRSRGASPALQCIICGDVIRNGRGKMLRESSKKNRKTCSSQCHRKAYDRKMIYFKKDIDN